jgi:hypothetical protein
MQQNPGPFKDLPQQLKQSRQQPEIDSPETSQVRHFSLGKHAKFRQLPSNKNNKTKDTRGT